MNAKMLDGTARCADHCDGVPEGQTADPCLYCGAVPVAPVADPHRRCEHRKTVTFDHAQDCPVFTDGAEGRACTCHYSDARCDELTPAAPVEPEPVQIPGDPDLRGAITEGDALYIGRKPHPWHVVPGTMGPRMREWSARVREVAAYREMERQDVLSALPAWIFAR